MSHFDVDDGLTFEQLDFCILKENVLNLFTVIHNINNEELLQS